MKKIIVSILSLFLVAIASNAMALYYEFSGVSEGGTGSATMDISFSGNEMTLVLNNTSPTENENAPGITGFGFDISNPGVDITGWELKAFDTNDVETTIGFFNDNSLDWKMNTSIAGVDLDYLPTTSGSNIQGALYNPDAVSSALAAAPNYFTTATLTMTFSTEFILDKDSLFVRMQNVGVDGEGSLKLYGTPGNEIPTVPEPGTIVLLGAGLFGIGCIMRRKKNK